MVSKKDLDSAEPWGHHEVRRRWWRPLARCKLEKKRQKMSNNRTYLSKLCFLKKLAQFFPWWTLWGYRGYTYYWTSCQKPHPTTKKAKELIALYQTMSHSWFLVYQRVLLQLHFHLLHHLHHRIPHLIDVNRYTENPVPARSGSTSEELRGNPLHESTETENKNKNGGREEVQSDKPHDLPELASGIQGEFGWWQYFNGALEKTRARKSRHFQVISWITNGAASKSGTRFL